MYTHTHTHTGMFFSFKKGGNSDTCYNIDETSGHYVKKPVTKGHTPYDSTYVRYLEGSNS